MSQIHCPPPRSMKTRENACRNRRHVAFSTTLHTWRVHPIVMLLRGSLCHTRRDAVFRPERWVRHYVDSHRHLAKTQTPTHAFLFNGNGLILVDVCRGRPFGTRRQTQNTIGVLSPLQRSPGCVAWPQYSAQMLNRRCPSPR